jgi:UDPglucose 6-dehydrogenase
MLEGLPPCRVPPEGLATRRRDGSSRLDYNRRRGRTNLVFGHDEPGRDGVSERNGSRKPAIGVIGAGWVGLVTGACFAELGHSVVFHDVDPERVAALRRGRLPIHEPGLADLFERNRDRVRLTTDIEELFDAARLAFVCVGTPPTYSGDADLAAVWRVVDELPKLARRTVLVMKSTVPPGTGQKVRARLEARGLAHVGYVSNPEFLAEGTAVSDFMNPDRVVIGAFNEADGDHVAALYRAMSAQIVRADVTSAEMIKLASNAFLATKISFINEIANVCEETGADVTVVARGMGLDSRIGPRFLGAGIGYGGSCFPKDVAALKQLAGNTGYHFQLLTAVIEVNELQKRRVVAKLNKHLGSLRNKTVALLGLSFKPNTNDMREASSLVLSARLLAEGAQVRAWDPVALDEAKDLLVGAQLCADPLEALEGAHAAVIVTEWSELKSLSLDQAAGVMARRVIVDGRNLLDPEVVRAAGFVYEGIGRPAPKSEPADDEDMASTVALARWIEALEAA